MPFSSQKTVFVCLWQGECVAKHLCGTLSAWNESPCIFLMCSEKHFDPLEQEGVNYPRIGATACPGSFFFTLIHFSCKQPAYISSSATTRDEGVILDAGFYFSILYFFSSCTPWNVFLLPNKCFWFHNTCTGEVDLPSWQQVPDHLTDKFESNKNTPGLAKDQSQPDRIMWAETTY